ncbi:cytochrome P450 [Streptomyces uncialis]|uniref:cytochrome P450 n=1 Tax=Streptomyces uncialis TaxID=1048205 RepID=UPI0033F64158
MKTPIPTVPGALPLLGHALPLIRDRMEFMRTLSDHGELVEIRLGPWRVLVVTDAELTRVVLREHRTFDKGGPLYERARELSGNGLSNCSHREHLQQRRLVQPNFHRDRLRDHTEIISRESMAVIETWRDDRPIDVLSDMRLITTRITADTMFDRSLTSADAARIGRDVGTVVAGVLRRALVPPLLARLPTPGNLRYHRAIHRLRHIIDASVAEPRMREGGDHESLLTTLLAASSADGHSDRVLSDQEVRDQVVTFILAGMSTTADALSWALHLVARHPRIQEALWTETANVLGGRAAGFEDLPRLSLTRYIILESLRLYPPFPLSTRLVTEETRLNRFTIPAGTTLAFCAYTLHHRADYFPDPENFAPTRWAGWEDPLRPPRIPFTAFGGGPRQCIGDRFALVQATITLANIASRWELHPTRRSPHPAVDVALSPRGLRLRPSARPRNP